MIMKYIEAALANVSYEFFYNDEPWYGDIADLPRVWATGKAQEVSRKNLAEIVDEGFVV